MDYNKEAQEKFIDSFHPRQLFDVDGIDVTDGVLRVLAAVLTEARKKFLEEERARIRDWVVKNYSCDAQPLYAHVDVADLLGELKNSAR